MKFFASYVLLLVLLLSPIAWGQESPPPQNDNDRLLTSQLREAFRQVPGLDDVTLEVRGGVVVLRGTVPSLEQSLRAEELAQKLEGVLTVDNGLRIDNDVRERISPALAALNEKGRAFVAFLPLLGIALVVFITFWTLGGMVSRWKWLYPKIARNVFMQDMLRQVVAFFFGIVGALIALEILNATALVGALLGTAGVMGIAIGFAFRDLAENSLASILLSVRQPFSPNDHVIIDGQEGKVVRLTSRATILLTLEGNHLRIPNATVFKASILNFTRNPERRFSFTVGVDTDEDLSAALALAVDTLKTAPGVLEEPVPQCLIQALGESTVDLQLLAWVNQTDSEFLKVRSEAIRRVKEAFDEADIFMPEPIYTVRLQQTEARGKKHQTPPAKAAATVDLEPETHLDKRIVEERRSSKDDLLDQSARQE